MIPASKPALVENRPLTWQTVACPVCGSEDEKELLITSCPGGGDSYRLVQCRSCLLGYVNPRPDPASIGRFYPEDYCCYQTRRSHRRGLWSGAKQYLHKLVLAHCYDHPVRAHLAWPERILATLLGHGLGWGRRCSTTLAFRGQGDMLDFGCGAGWFAFRMREQGWNVTGMDFNAHAAQRARLHYNIKVIVGTLPHPEVGPESFDLITMSNVLEHIHSPHPVIAAAARALRPGGSLIITVPNLESLAFRYWGPDWWALDLPRHLLHFSPAPLRRLVEGHGLHVTRLRMLPRKAWMRRSFARGRHSNRHPLVGQLGRVRLIPSLVTRWSVWTQQADCITLEAQRAA